MKTIVLGGLFSSVAAMGLVKMSTVDCAVDCASQVVGIVDVDGLNTLCFDMVKQRNLLRCLAISCPSGAYGPALASVITSCSELGAFIGPLHPVEVQSLQNLVARQLVPMAPGPVLADTYAEDDGQLIKLQKDFSVSIDCRAGSDGVLTLSLPEPSIVPEQHLPTDNGSPASPTTSGAVSPCDSHPPCPQSSSAGSAGQSPPPSTNNPGAAGPQPSSFPDPSGPIMGGPRPPQDCQNPQGPLSSPTGILTEIGSVLPSQTILPNPDVQPSTPCPPNAESGPSSAAGPTGNPINTNTLGMNPPNAADPSPTPCSQQQPIPISSGVLVDPNSQLQPTAPPTDDPRAAGPPLDCNKAPEGCRPDASQQAPLDGGLQPNPTQGSVDCSNPQPTDANTPPPSIPGLGTNDPNATGLPTNGPAAPETLSWLTAKPDPINGSVQVPSQVPTQASNPSVSLQPMTTAAQNAGPGAGEATSVPNDNGASNQLTSTQPCPTPTSGPSDNSRVTNVYPSSIASNVDLGTPPSSNSVLRGDYSMGGATAPAAPTTNDGPSGSGNQQQSITTLWPQPGPEVSTPVPGPITQVTLSVPAQVTEVTEVWTTLTFVRADPPPWWVPRTTDGQATTDPSRGAEVTLWPNPSTSTAAIPLTETAKVDDATAGPVVVTILAPDGPDGSGTRTVTMTVTGSDAPWGTTLPQPQLIEPPLYQNHLGLDKRAHRGVEARYPRTDESTDEPTTIQSTSTTTLWGTQPTTTISMVTGSGRRLGACPLIFCGCLMLALGGLIAQ